MDTPEDTAFHTKYNKTCIKHHSGLSNRNETTPKIFEVVRDTSRWLCLVVADTDTADMTVVSAVSATTRHDRFFYLTTKDLAPFSIHIPTKNPSFTLINDFVVNS